MFIKLIAQKCIKTSIYYLKYCNISKTFIRNTNKSLEGEKIEFFGNFYRFYFIFAE